MSVRTLLALALGGAFLVVPGTLAAQTCELCKESEGTCWEVLDPEVETACISWDEDPETGLEAGCDEWSAPLCGPSFALDITGVPASASLLATYVPEEGAWIRRGCDDAVVMFTFTRDNQARLARDTEFIGL